MPLRSELNSWLPDEDVRHSLGTAWACGLAGWLNRGPLGESYRASPDVQSEVKVLEELLEHPAPPPTVVAPALVPDRQQVIVTAKWDWSRPLGVVTFVTPRIKANHRKRAAFVARCLALLTNATALVVIDAVPGPHPTPCAELASALGLSVTVPPLSALSFRTAFRRGETELDVWVNELIVGESLPLVPLGLRGGPVVLLDLEATYTAAIEATGL